MHCPCCESADVHPSQSGNARTSYLLRPLLVALRCYKCHTRFMRVRVLFLLSRLLPQAR